MCFPLKYEYVFQSINKKENEELILDKEIQNIQETNNSHHINNEDLKETIDYQNFNHLNVLGENENNIDENYRNENFF